MAVRDRTTAIDVLRSAYRDWSEARDDEERIFGEEEAETPRYLAALRIANETADEFLTLARTYAVNYPDITLWDITKGR